MSELKNQFAERIISGLRRKTLTSCSRWATAYRVMGQPYPGPWSFRHHPWLLSMHDSEAEMNVGQKSAQMGYTETVLNVTFYFIDVKAVDCLYVLPAKTPDASDFSASRFDASLELSPHLQRLFSDVKNVGHKRAGNTNLYIRGSRSKSGLKSVPVGLIVLDELDEMTQENIPLALERASGQVEKLIWMISTATLEGHGINYHFERSSKNHFFFNCPACSRMTELTFPDSLVITADDLDDPEIKNSHLICKECKAVLDHKTKPNWLADGKWVEEKSARDIKGWYINQLYSPTVTPADLGRAYIRGLTDRSSEQEFYNSKLGLPHRVDGSSVTDADIEECKGNYKIVTEPVDGLITMGVDVGVYLHYEIDQWFLPPPNIGTVDLAASAKTRVIKHGKVRDFEELDRLMRHFLVNFCVIDAQPERRKALEFANRFYGHVRTCFYPNGINGKTIHVNEQENSVSVDRTSWLDLSLGRFMEPRSIALPFDVDYEYRSHIKALVRVYDKDKEGNQVGRYKKAESAADHYAHARNYAEIALQLAVQLNTSYDISGVL